MKRFAIIFLIKLMYGIGFIVYFGSIEAKAADCGFGKFGLNLSQMIIGAQEFNYSQGLFWRTDVIVSQNGKYFEQKPMACTGTLIDTIALDSRLAYLQGRVVISTQHTLGIIHNNDPNSESGVTQVAEQNKIFHFFDEKFGDSSDLTEKYSNLRFIPGFGIPEPPERFRDSSAEYGIPVISVVALPKKEGVCTDIALFVLDRAVLSKVIIPLVSMDEIPEGTEFKIYGYGTGHDGAWEKAQYGDQFISMNGIDQVNSIINKEAIQRSDIEPINTGWLKPKSRILTPVDNNPYNRVYSINVGINCDLVGYTDSGSGLIINEEGRRVCVGCLTNDILVAVLTMRGLDYFKRALIKLTLNPMFQQRLGNQ